MIDWPPGEIIAVLRWLPDTSPLHAAIRGGIEHYGWGRDRYMHADALDIALAIGMGAGGKKFGPKHAYLRPSSTARGGGRSLTSLIPRMQRRVSDG